MKILAESFYRRREALPKPRETKPAQLWSWVCLGALIAAAALAFWGPADAAVRYTERVENVPGLRFENFVYAWDKVELDVVNTTSSQTEFKGTMIFLDRRSKPLARASLLPKKIAPHKTERYTAYFTEGTGETAQRAERVIWDLGAR